MDIKLKKIIFLFLVILSVIGCQIFNPKATQTSQRSSIVHSIPCRGGEFLVGIPKDYDINIHRGPDFNVYFINKKGDEATKMSIYVGHFPSPVPKIDQAKEISGKINNQLVTWTQWEIEKNGKVFYYQHTCLRNPFGSESENPSIKYLALDIGISGPDENKIKILQQIAEAIKAKK